MVHTISTQRTRLSTLLDGLSPHEVAAILKAWDDALTSTVLAIPDPQKTTFKVMTVNGSGRKEEKEIQDEIIIDTPEFQQWLDTQRRTAHITTVQATGNFEDIPADLLSDDDEMFLKLAEARRKYKTNQKKKTRPAPTAARPSSPPAGTSTPARTKPKDTKVTTETDSDKTSEKGNQPASPTTPVTPTATDQTTPDTSA